MEKKTGNYHIEFPPYNTEFTSAWQSLAIAIVVSAAKEYAFYYQNSKMSPSANLLKTIEAKRQWFSTSWCEALLYFGTNGENISGSFLVQEIERMVNENPNPAKSAKKRKEEAV